MTGGHDDRMPGSEPRRWECAGTSTGRTDVARAGPGRAGAGVGLPRRRVRWHGVAVLVSGVAVLLSVVSRVGEATVGATRSLTAPGPARLEDVVGALAGVAAFGLLLWVVLALVSSAVVALVPRRSGRPGAWSRVLAPAVFRHAVAALVSAAVIGVAAPAGADTGASSHPAVTCESTTASPVVLTATGGPGPDAMTPAWVATPPDLSPGWLPSRPSVRRPANDGADASVVSQPRRRASATVDDEVVVRRGDSLWTIAARYLGPDATDAHIADEWPRWYQANRSVLRHGPDRLEPGLRLTPPPPESAVTGSRPAVASAAGSAGGPR
jgi:hypothetical protein